MNNPYFRLIVILAVPLLIGLGVGYALRPSGIEAAHAQEHDSSQICRPLMHLPCRKNLHRRPKILQPRVRTPLRAPSPKSVQPLLVLTSSQCSRFNTAIRFRSILTIRFSDNFSATVPISRKSKDSVPDLLFRPMDIL